VSLNIDISTIFIVQPILLAFLKISNLSKLSIIRNFLSKYSIFHSGKTDIISAIDNLNSLQS
jgi:hypothetical protein